MIQRGNTNYRSLYGRATVVAWRNLCEINEGEIIDIEDDIAALEECMVEFNPLTDLPTSLAEVEAINSMRFDPTTHCEEPADLFQHADGLLRCGSARVQAFVRTLCIGQLFRVHPGFVLTASCWRNQ
ncbi:unnamed protein product [Phytophthora fragariaefolia]|uniref:Unnamed protein product n=1 Tax=Phytophthora fragariaefolia TaxID=1490495 RepID=A0A9W7D2V0_9STRA|nr:unnamed protein product [Phytophthora fragariaefolia]